MIQRDLSPKLKEAARSWPSITLTGPRQSGKTTLCRALFPGHPYTSLEDPDVRAFATEDPRAFLAQFPQGAIFDEVQRAPDLPSYLQGVIDADPAPGRWILTGSQNLALHQPVSQSLAGRTAVHTLLPLSRSEIVRFPRHPETLEEALFAGSYPRIFDCGLNPSDWLGSYVATYLERDVRMISNIGDLAVFQNFLALAAGRTGQFINYSSLSGDCGISQPTAKTWLGILEASFLAFRLPAFQSNARKRLKKMPKLHFHDTGLVCWLLGIRTPEQLHTHPLHGSIFETWVVSEIVKRRTNQDDASGLFCYRDRNDAEVDLVVERSPGLTLVEAKSAKTPSSSMFHGSRRVQKQLARPAEPCPIMVVYGGDQFQRRGMDRLLPWSRLHEQELGGVIVTVRAADGPIAGADVLVLFPNTTWKRSSTDANGVAEFELYTTQSPMTVFVAAAGFDACLQDAWIPGQHPLDLELERLPGGGAVIFPNGSGELPILQGRLNPKLDAHGRTYLYTDNVAVNGGVSQPVHFTCGERLYLGDAEGRDTSVQIIAIVGRAALVQYHGLVEGTDSPGSRSPTGTC